MLAQILFPILILSIFSSTHSTTFFSPIPKEPIPNTSLKTGTFYKVTTSNTATKHLTWSFKTHPTLGHRYIISDNNSTYSHLYQKGSLNYLQDQWYFLPCKKYPGWYHLANRGIPGEFAGWSSKNGEALGVEIYYLILNPRYSIDNPEHEYLFKPVQDGLRYTLKTKSLPNAFITVFNKEEIQNSSRFYLSLYNEDDPNYRSVHLKGGKWFIYTLFKFESVEEQPILSASISKIQLTATGSAAQNYLGLSTLFSQELTPKLVIINNGSSTLSKEYSAQKEISEHVIIEPPSVFSNIPKISVEDTVSLEIEDNPAIPILSTPTFKQYLISSFSSFQQILSKPTWNYVKSRDFSANQTIEVGQCTEYHIIARVNIQKNLPIEYIVTFKLTGESDDQQISAFQLKNDHLYKIGLDGDNDDYANPIEILDEYTILVQVKSKMWVTFAKDFNIIGKGYQIKSCMENYICN